MDFDGILHELETTRVWSSRGQTTPELAHCKFCGSDPVIYAANPKKGWSGATVWCPNCGAQGPRASIYATIFRNKSLYTPLLPTSLMHGVYAAIEAWNSGQTNTKQLGNVVL